MVFATTPTFDGSQPASVTFERVGEGSIVLKFQEPNDLDDMHVPETVSPLTLENRNWNLEGGSRLVVGTTEVAAGSTRGSCSVQFEQAFDDACMVMVQLQTDKWVDWKIARAHDAPAGVQSHIQKAEASDGVPAAETVGWFNMSRRSSPSLRRSGSPPRSNPGRRPETARIPA